jgi:hypothetical protein
MKVFATAALSGLLAVAPYAATTAGATPPQSWAPVPSANQTHGAGATNELTGVSCHAGACTSVGVAAVGGVTSDVFLRLRSGGVWKRSTASIANAGGMTAISCPTKTWCMAVGARALHHGLVPYALISRSHNLKYAGGGLTTAAKNTPELSAVSCRSTHFCIAVGSAVGEDSLHAMPIVTRWNGHHWTTMHSPDPGIHVSYNGVAPIGVSLTAVRCQSTHSCIAVGNDLKVTSPPPEEQTSSHFTYAMKYNGSKWHTIATPNVSPTGTTHASARPNDGLVSLACRSASDCFATGNVTIKGNDHGFVEKWNGSSWKLSFAEGTALFGLGAIACGSPSSCYTPLVPDAGTPLESQVQLLHWHGTWSQLATHAPPTDTIDALTCPSVSTCYAVGSAPDGTGGSHTLILLK